MQLAYIEYLNTAGKTYCTIMQEVHAINSLALQKLADLQFNFASIQIENTLEHVKLYTTTTKHNQLLSGVSNLVDQYRSQTMDITHKAAYILASSSEDVLALMSKGFPTTARIEKTPVKRSTKNPKKKVNSKL